MADLTPARGGDMVQMHDGGGGGAAAAAQEVEVTIELIQTLANQTMADLEERARADGAEFRAARIPASAFGQAAPGQHMAQTALAAHEVFEATVDGLLQVLRQYQANLLAVVRTYASVDEASAAGLARLTPEELISRFVERNAETVARDERGHVAVESREQEAYAQNQDVFAGTGPQREGSDGPQGDVDTVDDPRSAAGPASTPGAQTGGFDGEGR